MRNTFALIVAACTLMLVPAMGAAAPSVPQTKPAAKSSHAQPASHATTGVVKSIDETTLIITRSGKSGGEMTFDLNTATHREGALEVGVPVSIRYRDEHNAHIATAVTAQPAKRTATHGTKPSR